MDADADTMDTFNDDDALPHQHWHKKVITAVMARSASALEKLLEHPASQRQSIIDHCEDIIATVSITVRSPLSNVFRPTLEMLMYVLCEYGRAEELIIYFSSVLDKEEHTAAEVEFFLPNIQGTLLRLSKFRLFWLSSVLSQLDDYVGDFDWNRQDGEDSSDNFEHLLRMHALVCDFDSSFVEAVKLSRTTFNFPAEKNCSEEEAVLKYRQCLGRSLLHLLAAPLGFMPVSFAKSFASYTRIVALLGQVVPDYSVFTTWSRKSQPEVGDGLMRCPVSRDSIAHLAFLVKICDVLPDNFPAVLSPLYFLNDIVLPFADFHSASLKQQNVHFLGNLIDQLPDRSLDSEATSPLLKDRLVDFLKETSLSENEKHRKRLYLLVQKCFLKMSIEVLVKTVGEIWTTEGMSNFPAILEVLVMAVKRPMVDPLRNASLSTFSQEEYRYLFKLFFSTENFSSNVCGLLANISGVFTVMLSLDEENKSGVRDVIEGVMKFRDRWKNAVDEHMEQVREELWSRKEAERLGAKQKEGASRDSMGPEVTAEQAQMIAQKHEFDAGILLMSLDGLSTQIERLETSIKL
ncbi:hypothetical protein RvY_15262-1 [Ramazzottius varieornatus]|uniref:Ubiquitin conjugation factor E4 core domain-containing protein n=1 Tax=Ramazzottius varieornatus TaxID=947166 RepID=A0A1D1VVL7_RAMVA|nr:hypothetical protein RvY_15262-1 [Ramazzottius varieornatus]